MIFLSCIRTVCTRSFDPIYKVNNIAIKKISSLKNSFADFLRGTKSENPQIVEFLILMVAITSGMKKIPIPAIMTLIPLCIEWVKTSWTHSI